MSEFEYAIKYRKPIMVITDFQTPIPNVIPNEWKKFEGLLKSARVQEFFVYYLTEFATKMTKVRKNPALPEHKVCFCDFSFTGNSNEVRLFT